MEREGEGEGKGKGGRLPSTLPRSNAPSPPEGFTSGVGVGEGFGLGGGARGFRLREFNMMRVSASGMTVILRV